MMGEEQDANNEYLWHVKQAKGGDVDSARELLHGFCSCVEQRKPLPPAIQDFFYLAFAQYLRGDKSIEQALELTRPARRPKGVVTADPIRAVAALHLAIKRDRLRKERAKDAVCNKLGLSKRNLERFDAKYNLIRRFNVGALEQLVQDRAFAKKQR